MSKTLIQLFAKPPVEGKVKTRLIPDVGSRSATAIYQHCLQANLELVRNSSFDYQIWLSGASSHPLFNHEAVHYQQGNNLGEKMFHALSGALYGGYDRVILIGSDCLDLTEALLQRACRKLDRHGLVFIPALDGGYVLIAARKSINAELFINIDWSTDRVLKQTLATAMGSGIATAVLNPLRDIDTVDDLQHYSQLQQFLTIKTCPAHAVFTD